MVIVLLSEAYILMVFVLLHLSMLTCDHTCSFELENFSSCFPIFVK